jgi:hypothetical protein
LTTASEVPADHPGVSDLATNTDNGDADAWGNGEWKVVCFDQHQHEISQRLVSGRRSAQDDVRDGHSGQNLFIDRANWIVAKLILEEAHDYASRCGDGSRLNDCNDVGPEARP